MKKIELKNEKDSIEFKYTFNQEDWKKIIKKQENKLLKNVKVDGFRPGSDAAKQHAKKMIDTKDLLTEAVNPAINFGLKDLVLTQEFIGVENELANISPDIDILKISNEELEVNYKFKKVPEVTVGDWRKIKIKAKLEKVGKKDIDAEIDSLLMKNSTMQPKTEGAIEKGDTATFDFKGFLEGVAFENGEAKNYDLEIGSNQFIPGFEDQMIGLKIGEEKTIAVNFPEEYHEKKLAGKPVTFEIKIHDIKTKKDAELNDEFVAGLDMENVTNVEQLKNHLQEKLTMDRENNHNREIEQELVEALIELTKLSYEDEKLYEHEKNQLIEKNKNQFAKYGLSFEDFLKITNMTEEKFIEQAATEAKKLYLYKLGIDEIIKQDKDELSEEEFKLEIAKIASDAKKTVDEIIELVGDNVDVIKRDLLRLKKIRLIIQELTK